MAFQPNQALLGSVGGSDKDYSSSSQRYFGQATQAMGAQRPIQEDPGPTFGGAIGSGLGAAGTVAGITEIMGAAAPAFLSNPFTLPIAAGIGILSHILG